MNKVYKSIWNVVTQSFTAVSENQRSRGKRSKSLKLGGGTLLVALMFPTLAFAYEAGETIQAGSISFGAGYEQTILETETNVFWGLGGESVYISVSPKAASLSDLGGASSLISYSSDGLAQTVLRSKSLTVWGSMNDRFEVLNDDSDISQDLLGDDGNGNQVTVATLKFAIGERARNLVIQNIDNFRSVTYEDETLRGSYVTEDGEQLSYSYNEHGLAWHSGDNRDKDGNKHVWVLTLLTGVDISSGQTLVLDDIGQVETDSEGNVTYIPRWSAQVTGSGNISYIGDADSERTLNIETVLEKDADGSAYDDPNSYTGTTTVKNLTLNLLKQKALGNTSKLTAENSEIVLLGSHEENGETIAHNETVGALDFTGSSLKFSTASHQLTVTGDASFDSGSQLVGSGTLSATNTTLRGASNDFSGKVISSGETRLGHINALGKGVVETDILIFDAVDSDTEFSNSVNQGVSAASNIYLTNNSHVTYEQDATINTTSTIIEAGSSLTVVDTNDNGANTQLGSSVSFTNDVESEDYGVLSIQSTDTNPLSGISLSSVDKYAIVELNGARDDDERTIFVLDDNDNSGYKGWIRITNADLTLSKSHTNHGFSIGQGGNIFITGNETIELAMFGWSRDGGDGVLDLTGFEFQEGTGGPALKVNELYLDASATIKLDSSKFLKQSLPEDGTNILGWDADESGTDQAYRIVYSESEVIRSDTNYEITVIDEGETYTKDIDSGIATAYFQAVANVDEYGVLIEYGMNKLELKNADSNKNTLNLQLSDNVNNELRALLSGSGKLSVTKALGSNVSEFKLSNESNSFTNSSVTINEGITLIADIGALGQTGLKNSLTLNNATYKTVKVNNDNTVELQELESLSSGGESTSTVILADYTGLGLTGTSEWTSVVLEGNNTTVLKLSEGSSLSVSNAGSTLGNYSGSFDVDGTLSLIYNLSDSAYTAQGISGTGIINLTNANWTLGDVSFSGTYNLTASQLVVNSTGDCEAKQVALDGSSYLIVTGRSDLLGDSEIKFTGSDTTELAAVKITNSSGQINLSQDSTTNGYFELKGNSSVSIDYESLLTTLIERDSVFTYNMSGDNNEFSLTSISGEGTLGLAFEDHVDDLLLRDYSRFSGIVRFDNATLSVGEHTSYGESGLTGINGIQLHVGENSVLKMKGQAEFSQDIIFEGGSVADFTYADGYNSSGLSANAMLFTSGSGLVVNGASYLKVNFDASKITISDDIGSKAGDSLLDALGATEENPAEALRLMDSITLKEGQTAGSLLGSMELVDSTESSALEKTIAYEQDGSHVANIIAGVGLISTENEDKTINIGIGGTVTELQLLTELDIDVSNRDDVSDSAEILSKITGTGNIAFSSSGSDVEGEPDVLLQSAHTGTTTVKDGVWVQANNGGALGKTSMLNIGADENDTARVTLNSSGSQYFEQSVGGINVQRSATLELVAGEARMDLVIDGELGDSVSVLKGTLIGSESSQLHLTNGASLLIDQDTDLEDFEGIFALNADGTLVYDVSDGQEGTFSSRVSGNGFVEKTGAGTLTLSNTGSVMNLRLSDGTVNLENGIVLDTFIMGAGSTSKAKSNSDVVTEIDGVLTIYNFVGNGGTFVMDVALGESSGNGDTVELGENDNDGLHIVESATGQATIQIRDKNGLSKGAEERIKLVEIDSNADVTFSLAGGAVTAGAYDYTLVREDRSASGDEVETGSDWYLSSIEGQEQIRNTTVHAGSYIAIASAAQLFDLSLHDRVGNRDWINPVTGEKQSTSLWMHQTFSHERSRDSTNQIRMRNTSSVTMLGGDLVQWTTSGNGMAYAGVMGGYGTMDTKSRSHRTNLRSDADTDAWGVGAYFGWKADSDAFTGPYVDGWVMFTHADSTVEGTDVREDAKGQGLSASIEAGWGFHVGSVKTDNGKTADFHIEPHASATWFGMNYDDISNETHDVTFEGHNNVRTRLVPA